MLAETVWEARTEMLFGNCLLVSLEVLTKPFPHRMRVGVIMGCTGRAELSTEAFFFITAGCALADLYVTPGIK